MADEHDVSEIMQFGTSEQEEHVNSVLDEYLPLGQLPHTLFVVLVQEDPPSPLVPCPEGQVEVHVIQLDWPAVFW